MINAIRWMREGGELIQNENPPKSHDRGHRRVGHDTTPEKGKEQRIKESAKGANITLKEPLRCADDFSKTVKHGKRCGCRDELIGRSTRAVLGDSMCKVCVLI